MLTQALPNHLRQQHLWIGLPTLYDAKHRTSKSAEQVVHDQSEEAKHTPCLYRRYIAHTQPLQTHTETHPKYAHYLLPQQSEWILREHIT